MADDADWWPPEDQDSEVDPMWLPPFNGKTRFEYLSSFDADFSTVPDVPLRG